MSDRYLTSIKVSSKFIQGKGDIGLLRDFNQTATCRSGQGCCRGRQGNNSKHILIIIPSLGAYLKQVGLYITRQEDMHI